jgi:mannose/fructose/N-acetylgalactosamine-specific phosphotransferase system component IIB
MGVLLYRIDDRLIHGQVVEGWFHTLQPDRVVVADDEAAGSAFQRNLMELVVPYGVKTDILPVRETVQRYQKGAFNDSRTIVLFRHPRDVVTALGLGLTIEQVNLGGLHATGETRFLSTGVLASTEDLRDLRTILDAGVRVEVRPVPSEPAVDLRGLL